MRSDLECVKLFFKYAGNDSDKAKRLQEEYWRQMNIKMNEHHTKKLTSYLYNFGLFILCSLIFLICVSTTNLICIISSSICWSMYSIQYFKSLRSFDCEPFQLMDVKLWLDEYADLN